MPDLREKTEDHRSRLIRLVLHNTKPDGSGDFFFPCGQYSTPTRTAPTIGSSTTLALAANNDRLYALFANNTDETIFIEIGGDAVQDESIPLSPLGGSYEMSREIGNLNTGVINGICSSGGKKLVVLEGV